MIDKSTSKKYGVGQHPNSLNNLKKHAFKPGESGNLNGAPKGTRRTKTTGRRLLSGCVEKFFKPNECVYFIICKSWVKIGHTKRNIKDRIYEMAIGNPYPLKLYGSINNVSIGVETFLHKKYDYLRGKGEWFDIRIIDIIEEDYQKLITKHHG